MKYKVINPEAFATKITNENRPLYPEGKVGDYVVTFSESGSIQTIVMTEIEFLKKYKPALPMNDARREMYRLCTEIIEQQSLIDDGNAETLLAHAVDLATALRKLI